MKSQNGEENANGRGEEEREGTKGMEGGVAVVSEGVEQSFVPLLSALMFLIRALKRVDPCDPSCCRGHREQPPSTTSERERAKRIKQEHTFPAQISHPPGWRTKAVSLPQEGLKLS